MTFILCAFLVLAGSAALAQDKPAEANYDESKVPQYTLPDPLTVKDGRKVDSAEMWMKERRPELLDLFAEEMFGRATLHRSGNPFKTTFENLESESVFNGKGTRHQFDVVWTKPDAPPHRVQVLVYVPKTEKKVAAFLGLNFQGNHTVAVDPGIKLGNVWDRSKKTVEPAKEEDRGKAARRWPFELLIDRGYALVTAHYCDIEPDFNNGIRHGVRRFLYADGEKQKPDEANTIATWAWGLGEILDGLAHFENKINVDPKRVAVIGHSRLGKTSLWAGAIDSRFAMVISNDSGCGGSALSRREFGETVHRINVSFPHWFCDNFKKYNKAVDTLPFDQHELVALIAPRPVYVASATEDLWADPKGEFLSALHAEPVYRLMGTEGFAGVKEPPKPDQSVGGTIRYHNRTGKHDIIEFDWKNYCDFADKYLK